MEYRSWFLCFRIRVHEIAGLILIRPDYDFMGCVLEVVQRIADEMLELSEEHPRLGPFAVFAESDVADHSLDGVGTQPGCDLGLIGALRAFNGLCKRLAG